MSRLAIGSSALGLMLASQAFAAPVSLLNDSFADNERSTQGLVESAKWFLGRNGTTSTSDGKLAIAPTAIGTSFIAVSYFAESGSPRTLEVGDKIELSFTFSASSMSTADQGLRFGLFNSAATRMAGDITDTGGASSHSFSDDRGYGVFYGIRSSGAGNNFAIGERSGTADPLFTQNNGFAFINAVGSCGTSTVSELQTATLRITYTDATTMTLDANVGGNPLTRIDSASPRTSFDSVGLFSDGRNGTLSFDDIRVTYTPIPEPTSIALLALGSLAMLRRRS